MRGRGLLEETIVLVPTPQSLVAEGIAELAPSLLLEGDGGAALAAVVHDAGIEFDLAHALAVDARPRAVPVGGGQRRADAARRGRDRGRGARVPRALGPDDARSSRPT